MIRRALLLATALLAGCGYHLRGSSVETSIPSAYVNGAEGVAVTDELIRALRVAGVQVLDASENAAVAIDLMQQTQGTRTLSYTDRVTTAESQLELAIRFKIVAGEKELVPERWARATRTYLVDTNNLVGSSQQQQLMDSELRSDVVQQIMRSVSAAGRQMQTTPH